MSEIMLKLATHYRIGISVISGVLIVIYTVLSIMSVRRFYLAKGKISLWGMIPLIQLKYFLPSKKKTSEVEGKNTSTNDDIDAIFEDDLLDDIF